MVNIDSAECKQIAGGEYSNLIFLVLLFSYTGGKIAAIFSPTFPAIAFGVTLGAVTGYIGNDIFLERQPNER